MSDVERLHLVELEQVRQGAIIEGIKHDTGNLRMAMSGTEKKNDIRHGALDARLNDLNNTIWRTMLSILVGILMLFVSIIGYFIVQKDSDLMEHRKIMERHTNVPTH